MLAAGEDHPAVREEASASPPGEASASPPGEPSGGHSSDFWRIPLPALAEDGDPAAHPSGDDRPGVRGAAAPAAPRAEPGAGTCRFDFWRLPLPELGEDDSVGAAPSSGGEPPVLTFPARTVPRGAPARGQGFDFWRLPLPELAEEQEDAADPGAAVRTESSPPAGSFAPAELSADAPPSPAPSPTPSCEEEEGPRGGDGAGEQGGAAAASEATDPAGVAPRLRTKRNLADEMADMLDRYAAEKRAFQQNLEELLEMQARLRELTVTSSLQNVVGRQPGGEGGDAAAQVPGALCLPQEIAGRVFWHLDCASLLRASCACPDWMRLVRSKARWQWLCEADWGLKCDGSLLEYRHRLERWRVLHSTLAGLKGSGCPSGICGSFARRKLFEALESLAELGAAEDPAARYPSQVPALLRATGADRTLVALLEDESPHLLCLAVRCLADLVADAAERPAVRTEVTQRGELVRRLLEGDDGDVVEAAARLMLNLHGAPGAPLGTRRRGPAAFAGPGATAAAAAAWSGCWSGEMRYARGGERHAALQLVLGAAGDPALEQAAAAFQAAMAAQAGGEGGGPARGSGARMRAEGQAEYWHYFGFLAASDFDCERETLRYVDEQIRRQRELTASPQHRPHRTAGLLAGVGWDEQNGAFRAEAQLPQEAVRAPPSPSSSSPTGLRATANAVPLRLTLKYESRGTYELTGFLAEGAGEGDDSPRVPVLYGVWATAPSQHRHLFALRLAAPLPEPS